jgi:signal peptidase II
MLVPLGMMLGGGLGNASDRLFRDLGGRVVDWIDLHVWPVFNLADSAIVVGVLLVIFMSSRKPAPDE